jgi:S1-C subfamily serine protease
MSTLKKIFLFFFVLTLNSCAYSNMQTLDPVQNLLKTAKKSFVKIEVAVWNLECIDTKDGEKECTKEKLGGAWGSGSVVKYKGKKHILTVAHICESERLSAMASLTQQKIIYDFSVTVEANDWNSYSAIPIKINHESDICLMSVEDIGAPYLKMSNKKPTYGEKIYTVASPGGLAINGMVPTFEGRFLGINDGRAFYSVPAMGGSSGSPLINKKGEVVGVTHSVYAYFHHVTVSTTFKELWKFVSN